ncbi:hypothetical protein NX862_00110 [Rhodobacter sp. KR11]|jgi:carbon monoxide dehydrogenase subunit G|uniref:hypothetical protein n=1 Tax=Rhodobacter sp. KR11 TaxID=2974588 RepID=UPI002222608E|nr:hypothetical protein [Rhodobacter sp. KR11]MCW1917148.1 hypothetical protein [Rhodobacter sp. KR11]
MQLDGSIRTTGPAELVARGLAQGAVLTAIAPFGFDFRKVEDGVADFTVRRSIGPISLTLQGTMALTETAPAFTLAIKAAHLIGGKVQVQLDLTTAPPDDDGLATLSWTGELRAQGLAGRVMAEREEQANEILRNLFIRLRDHVEGPPNVGPSASSD